MAHAFPFSRGAGAILFDEDFDLPPPSPEPEVIQPVYSAAELIAAREQAARDSRDEALLEADRSTRAKASRALAEIASQIAATREAIVLETEQSAEVVARLLLDCFAAAFPALSARHGADELAAVLRTILPALHQEPRILVRINPYMMTAMTEEIHALDADLAARVQLVPTDGIAPGDARITWENGTATRDVRSLWSQIESVLAPAGLLSTGPLNAGQTAKEHERVE